jgi:hypothetical protein
MLLPFISTSQTLSINPDSTVCFTIQEARNIGRALGELQLLRDHIAVKDNLNSELRQKILLLEPMLFECNVERLQLQESYDKSRSKYNRLRKNSILYGTASFLAGAALIYFAAP